MKSTNNKSSLSITIIVIFIVFILVMVGYQLYKIRSFEKQFLSPQSYIPTDKILASIKYLQK